METIEKIATATILIYFLILLNMLNVHIVKSIGSDFALLIFIPQMVISFVSGYNFFRIHNLIWNYNR
jgi:hypothetical protein